MAYYITPARKKVSIKSGRAQRIPKDNFLEGPILRNATKF